MKIFLTGASGFLGGATLRALVAQGHDCAVLHRGPSSRLGDLASGVQIVEGDFFAPDSYRAALLEFAPDALLHCGWWGVAGADRNDLRQLDNLPATGHLVAAALDAGAKIVVGVGSQGEYGPKAGRISEDEAPEPTTLYGISKLAACKALLALAGQRGARGAWGRVFSLYGPGDDGPWLVPSLIRAFREQRAPDLTGCEQIWEFTHVADAADALVALVECEAAQGVFNIGSGAPVSLHAAVTLLRDLVAPHVAPNFGAVPYRPDQVMHLEANIDRIAAVTGWRPRVALAEGFAQTVAAAKARAA